MQRRTTQKYRRDDKKKTFFSLFFWPCVRVPFGAAKRLTASTRSRGARETLATFYYFPSLSLPPQSCFLLFFFVIFLSFSRVGAT